MRQIRLTFEDKDFKKLENLKEANGIMGNKLSWERFILKLARIKNE